MCNQCFVIEISTWGEGYIESYFGNDTTCVENQYVEATFGKPGTQELINCSNVLPKPVVQPRTFNLTS